MTTKAAPARVATAAVKRAAPPPATAAPAEAAAKPVAGGAGTTGAGGKGGQAGGGGQGGKGGTGGSALTCAELQTAYAKAMVDARKCIAALAVLQCTQQVTSALACGCPTFVNDKTELDKIKAQWDAAACGAAILCPAIACPAPGMATCVPMNSGDVCVTTPTPLPAN
jgi:hypothetical protein